MEGALTEENNLVAMATGVMTNDPTHPFPL